MSDKAYLILENGKVFEGKSFGAKGTVIAEVVFATGMTGYLETLTDKSYYGQMVVQTFPLIGNYGIIRSDFESKNIHMSAYIVNQWCEEPSNFRSGGNLDAFLMEQQIVGLYDIDTRALVRIIRENGVMNGMITNSLNDIDFSKISGYKVQNAVSSVSAKEAYTVKEDNAKYKVALMDFGLKDNIVRELVKRGCEVTVLPYNTSADEIIKLSPDGIMLSNGPGDPAENVEIIECLKKLTQTKIPMFGICLGHQLLALANGCKTSKLKYGHRGANQPVKDLTTGRVYITSQNHGYAVESNSIDESIADEVFVNVNDSTCEGITYKNAPVFTVQFHPEACGGPKDTSFLFDRFIKMMGVSDNAVR